VSYCCEEAEAILTAERTYVSEEDCSTRVCETYSRSGATFSLYLDGLEPLLPSLRLFSRQSLVLDTTLVITPLTYSGSYMFPKGGFTVPDLIFSYFGAWFWFFNFFLWKIKGLVRGEQKWKWVSVDEMDFVTGLAEMDKLEEDDRRAEAEAPPLSFIGKVDKFLF